MCILCGASESQDRKERVVPTSSHLHYVLTYEWMGVSEEVIVCKRVAHVSTRKPFGVPGHAAFSRLVLCPNEREHILNALNHLSGC